MDYRRRFIFIGILFSLLVGCATTPPVREALKEDLSVPAGKIEGNQFFGIRYPFNISVPSPWKITMEFPDFLKELGYDKPSPMDKEQTELYVYNPGTKSSIQFDFTSAGQYSVFSQEGIERLTTLAAGGFKQELQEEYGKDMQVDIEPTEPISLKGVQFAAKKFGTYTIKGVKREQGWIYGFTEPYQLFILYMVLEKEGANDHQDLRKILESFEVVPKK